MVKKLFWKNPYATQLETHVVTVNGNDVTLEATIFYAFSGGQESDSGTMGGYKVTNARKDGLEIVYTLEPGHNLSVGDEVLVEIDWQRRYKLMRLHFAAEIVLKLVTRKFQGIEKIGAHISEDKARIDFLWPENLSPFLPELHRAADDLIAANLTIVSDYSDAASQRRYWHIENVAEAPCGGTHLKATGEVGAIRLKRRNVGSNKERIEIILT